jgi:PAS domain S-box-containing protein
VTMDVTEFKRLSDELQMKSDAIENSLNAFDIIDHTGRFVYANRTYLKMWGYENVDEIIGTSPAGHCADPAVPKRIISELKEKGECEIEFLAKRKDGSTFDVLMWARLAYDSDGKPIYPTTSIDITFQKQAMSALQAIEERYRLVAKATHDAIWDWDLTTNEVRWNETLSDVYGYPESYRQGRDTDWYAMVHPDDRERVVDGIHQHIDRGDENWAAITVYRLATVAISMFLIAVTSSAMSTDARFE